MIDAMMAAVGRIPSGLFVLTVSAGGRETGMLASWVQQCSFQPPRVSVAVSKERWVLPELVEGTGFVVNVLAEGDKKLVAHFGKGFAPDADAFAGLDVTRDGVPVLLAAHAFITCRVAARFDAGDHVLVVGDVVGGAVHHDARPATHVRRTGTHY
ncbi:flavin reductase family protein [Urbifossiella limnaea]|uniref:Diflavin flavoprotein A 3 n=1 Tax=Urbifossiella limnaea TaxID=2528023 RepID=A0A517XXZ9_9BACT|nr:flavin reductase family protein [Urbifossiella limnaea]QDU22374.1 Putative diflavin flavoprotein A 3 [Urbifossiella limnaea]